jgi:hypothetical protein
MHTIAHSEDVEVQEQAKFAAADFQVRQQLRKMYRQHVFHAFQLNDQAILDDEIDRYAIGISMPS